MVERLATLICLNIEDANDGDTLAMDIGADFAFHAGITFFIGVGLLIGHNWDKGAFIGA